MFGITPHKDGDFNTSLTTPSALVERGGGIWAAGGAGWVGVVTTGQGSSTSIVIAVSFLSGTYHFCMTRNGISHRYVQCTCK